MSDIQLAAEALQSLRASASMSPPPVPSSSSPEPLKSLSETISMAGLSNPSFSTAENRPTMQFHPSSNTVRLPPISSQTDSSYSHRTVGNLNNHLAQYQDSSYNSRISSTPYLHRQSSNSSLASDNLSLHSAPTSPPHTNALSPNIAVSGLEPRPTSPADSQVDIATSPNSTISNKRKRKIKPGFLNPLVASAAKIYQHGKSYSPRFKYSAEKLESAISSRMANNKPLPSINEPIPGGYQAQAYNANEKSCSNITPPTILPPISSLNPQTSSSRQSPMHKPKKRQKSTWHGVLVTASSIATSLSHENKQRLRYCLHLLKLANTHIAAKVKQLQDLLQEERATAMAHSIASNHVPNAKNDKKRNHFLGQKVNGIKRDIVWTIRKVISALSTYAGNSLPEPARSHVRNYILRLPARWATSLTPSNSISGSSTGYSTPVPGLTSTSTTATLNTPTVDNILSPVPSSPTDSKTNQKGTHSATFLSNSPANTTLHQSISGSPISKEQADEPALTPECNESQEFQHTDTEIANRVLKLATEALDMLGSIISIVDETLEKAEVWCDRFGRVGFNKNGSSKQSESGEQQDEYTTVTSTSTGTKGPEDTNASDETKQELRKRTESSWSESNKPDIEMNNA